MADMKTLDAEAAKAEIDNVAKHYRKVFDMHVAEAKHDIEEVALAHQSLPKTNSEMLVAADLALAKTIEAIEYINKGEVYRVTVTIDTTNGSSNLTMYHSDQTSDGRPRLKNGTKYRAFLFIVPVGPLDEKEQ